MATTRHLDLGCGPVPRNTYGRDELYGADISASADGRVRKVNLSIEAIPFESRWFDSVSAYDFLEHVPRVLGTPDGLGTRLPFVELMNEVWRVLKPGGLFYAVTPVFPHVAAFQDPTHVNVITTGTHEYFVRPQRSAALYGFVGDFTVRRVQRTRHRADALYTPPPGSVWERLRHAARLRRGACGHVIWELEAQHPA